MTRRRHGALLGLLFLLLLLALVIAGSIGLRSLTTGTTRPHATLDGAGLPTGPVGYDEINRHVEARLYYPGSTQVSRFGAAEYHHPLSGHNDAAFAGATLTSAATPEQIYLWYQRWALKRHWYSHDFIPLTTQRSTEGFVRGTREILIVAIDAPKMFSETTGRSIPQGRTVYEIRYEILPNGRTVS